MHCQGFVGDSEDSADGISSRTAAGGSAGGAGSGVDDGGSVVIARLVFDLSRGRDLGGGAATEGPSEDSTAPPALAGSAVDLYWSLLAEYR